MSTQDTEVETPDQTTEDTESRASAPRPPRRRLLTLALALVGVVTLALGVTALTRGLALRDGPAADNQALVDARSTARVESEVSQGIARVLTYDYTDPAPTEASARQVLRGQARTQYAALFTELRKRAAGQQLTLTATVRSIGVERLSGDRARLLVFLDQTSSRAGDDQSSLAAAQVVVSAQRTDGSWKITGLEPI